jgi:hypothetical protein
MNAELQLDYRTDRATPVGSGALLGGNVNPNDVWMTPPPIAADIVNHFKPTGRILDPCRGDGAFWNVMPGAEWCEAREGRNFYDWNEPVDWIVSNPPYSIYDDFMTHAMRLP